MIDLTPQTIDLPLTERMGGGGPMMEFDPDSDVQDYLRSQRQLARPVEEEK